MSAAALSQSSGTSRLTSCPRRSPSTGRGHARKPGRALKIVANHKRGEAPGGSSKLKSRRPAASILEVAQNSHRRVWTWARRAAGGRDRAARPELELSLRHTISPRWAGSGALLLPLEDLIDPRSTVALAPTLPIYDPALARGSRVGRDQAVEVGVKMIAGSRGRSCPGTRRTEVIAPPERGTAARVRRRSLRWPRPVWCRRSSGMDSNIPPTRPPVARDSSMILALKSAGEVDIGSSGVLGVGSGGADDAIGRSQVLQAGVSLGAIQPGPIWSVGFCDLASPLTSMDCCATCRLLHRTKRSTGAPLWLPRLERESS